MTTTYDEPPAPEYYEEREPQGQFDLAAERIVLGAMILAPADGETFDEIARIVTPEEFYRPAHQEIAREITALRAQGALVDLATLNRHFHAIRRIHAIGGPGYLADLIADCPSPAVGPWHAEAVSGFAGVRGFNSLGTWMSAVGNNPGTDPADLPELYDTAIKKLEVARSLIRGGVRTYTGDLMPDALERIENPEKIAVVRTGFHDLDQGIYLGHRPGDLIIVGARPSTGKTIFGLDLARHAAIRQHVPTLFASIEMSINAIMDRLIAAEARVDLNRIRSGTCTDADWARIAARMQDVTEAPLCIDHTPSMSIAQLDEAARDMQRERGLGLIVVDYLQIMRAPKAESRHQAVGQMAKDLRELGDKHQVPVIALAQLNRGPAGRTDKRPQMSDLRESGELEAHAETIFLLHRESQYDPESKRAGEIDVLLPKQRDGATGEVVLSFQGHYARCQSMATDWTASGILATNGARP